jgi:hypothetical protein
MREELYAERDAFRFDGAYLGAAEAFVDRFSAVPDFNEQLRSLL